MNTTTSAAPATALPRWVWWGGGAALLAIAGLASALVVKSRPAEPAPVQVAAVTPEAASPAPAKPTPAKPAAASDCKACGTVEAVQAVKKKGEGTGAGAVVGGVLGGVVGHQMGGGSGKDAMTIIGAIGGGVAGHEVEKRARAETVYQVTLRMDDGSKRTVTLAHAGVAKGDRVQVEGKDLRKLGAGGAKP